ncbi:MAG: O-methyltransferase [Planctomycetota bacterium]
MPVDSVPEAAAAVDAYLTTTLRAEDDRLAAAREATHAAGLPDISVSACQGQMLAVLAKSVSARRVLEIGSLGGYSTIQLARVVGDDGQVVTLEVDPHHADVARQNLDTAGVGSRTTLLIGPALRSLPQLADTDTGRFDFAFIDADKENIPAYFEWAVKLTRPGGMIVVDNVVRRGRLVDPDADDPAVLACRQLIESLADDDRVSATVVQTVGAKGHDGFVLAVVH